MKTGLTTSIAMHAALLAFGMLTLSAPSALEVADVESLPVDIVPIEDITQIQQGDKTATVNEKPAPKPTKRPDIVPDAQKVGENTVDTEKKPTPEAKPKPVETADAPPPSPEPMPKPADQPKPEPVKQPEPKPTPVPATEVTPQPEPKQEVKPDPVAETIAAEKPESESVELPNSAPSPAARPQPPQAQTAKAPERKEAEKKPVKEAATKPKSTEKSFNADEVAALLNKEKASGGGAKRSTEQAALGGDKSTGGSKLSQSEMDALRGQVQRCWNIPAGALDGDTLKVSVKFKLDPSGALEGSPEIISGGGSSGVERAAAEAARRAVARCAPYNLPADKYDAWADVIVNFDPSEMF
jgi:colicin import membrane protein